MKTEIHSFWQEPEKKISAEIPPDAVEWKFGSIMCVGGIFDQDRFVGCSNRGYTYCVNNVAFSCRVGLLQPEDVAQMISGEDPADVHMLENYRTASVFAKNLLPSAAPSP